MVSMAMRVEVWRDGELRQLRTLQQMEERILQELTQVVQRRAELYARMGIRTVESGGRRKEPGSVQAIRETNEEQCP